MSKILAGVAALALMGAAALPIQANAGERAQPGAANDTLQSTELSSQRRHWRHRQHWRHRHYHSRRYYAPRRHYGGHYPYYGYRQYGYARPYYSPGPYFGIGPFGFRVF